MGETACKRAKIDLWYHDWGYTSTLHILGEEPTHLGPQDRCRDYLSIYLSIYYSWYTVFLLVVTNKL